MFTLTSTPVTFIGLLILFAWSLVWSVRDAIKAPTVVTRISTWVHGPRWKFVSRQWGL